MLAMLDLDHFKRINDNYGHLAGDKVLKIIASVLRKRLRGTDFIARFGGEEFVLLMPATAPAAGAKLLEYLRAAIEACPFHFKGERVTITISMGLAAFKPGNTAIWCLKEPIRRCTGPKTRTKPGGTGLRAIVPFCLKLRDGRRTQGSTLHCCITVLRVLPSP
jgi:hypothetical protein